MEEIGLFDAMYHCRAMRKLDTKPVPEELLIVAIQYFTHVLAKPTSSSKPSNDSPPLLEK